MPATPPSPLALWRQARAPARLLFVAVAALFVARAVYEPDGRCDLGGYLVVARGVLDGKLDADTYGNTYPPTFSVVMAPLAALERRVGLLPIRHLWGAAQLAALAYVTLAFSRLLALELSLGAVAVAWLCAWRYVVHDLNNQNVSLVLWALVAWALVAANRGRLTRAGAILGIGASLKIMPAFAAIPLLARGAPARSRLVLGAAAGGGAMAALTFAVLGRRRFGEALEFWLHRIAPSFGGAWPGNQSWKGLVLRLWPSASAGEARLAALILGLGLFGAVSAALLLRPSATSRVRALDVVLAILAGLPALPVAWLHYFTATLPIGLTVAASWPRLERRRLVGALFASGTLVGALLDVEIVGARAWELAAHYGNALAGVLLVLAAGLVVREEWRREDAAAILAPAHVAEANFAATASSSLGSTSDTSA